LTKIVVQYSTELQQDTDFCVYATEDHTRRSASLGRRI